MWRRRGPGKVNSGTNSKRGNSHAKHLMCQARYTDYPQIEIHLGEVFQNALSTDGAAYFQMIGTSASSYSGMSSITPLREIRP